MSYLVQSREDRHSFFKRPLHGCNPWGPLLNPAGTLRAQTFSVYVFALACSEEWGGKVVSSTFYLGPELQLGTDGEPGAAVPAQSKTESQLLLL